MLKQDSFHASVDLILELDAVLQGMVAWCEQCPCHGHVQEHYKDRMPIEVARAECGEYATAGLPCPNRGCRAPEVAAGIEKLAPPPWPFPFPSMIDPLAPPASKSITRFAGRTGRGVG